MPEARDPLASRRAAASARQAASLALARHPGPSALVVTGGSCLRLAARAGLTENDFGTAARALAAVRDHVRTASPAGRK